MFFIQMLAAVFSYVVAKSIWAFVQVRAKVASEQPIVWLAKFTAVLAILLGTLALAVTFFGVFIYLLCTRS
jgi:hypothetical protein